MALIVVRNEIDGWDVVREDEGVAVSNHSTREEAEAAAGIRSDEERIGDIGGTDVEVDTEHVHKIDDTREGMKPAAAWFVGFAVVVVAIVVIFALVS